jgi:hypothetical protein
LPKKNLGVKIKAKMNFWINFGLGGVFGSKQKWISALGKFTPKKTGISLCSTSLTRKNSPELDIFHTF